MLGVVCIMANLLVTCNLHINWSCRGEMEENGAEVDEYVTYLFSLGVGMCRGRKVEMTGRFPLERPTRWEPTSNSLRC